MPNRIVREGWIESLNIDALDASAERFFLRLILKADDYGRFHANPVLLKSALFPLKDDIRSADMTRFLAACEKTGLIRCYETSGKRYLEIQRFNQRNRAKESKFPEPDIWVAVTCQSNDGQASDTGQSSAHGGGG